MTDDERKDSGNMRFSVDNQNENKISETTVVKERDLRNTSSVYTAWNRIIAHANLLVEDTQEF